MFGWFMLVVRLWIKMMTEGHNRFWLFSFIFIWNIEHDWTISLLGPMFWPCSVEVRYARLSVANFRVPNRGRLPVHNVTLGLLESTRDPSIACLFATREACTDAALLGIQHSWDRVLSYQLVVILLGFWLTVKPHQQTCRENFGPFWILLVAFDHSLSISTCLNKIAYFCLLQHACSADHGS